jgi:hypothetical protein
VAQEHDVTRHPEVLAISQAQKALGTAKWNVLTDEDVSKTMPEVFDPPREILAGFMAQEVDRALLKWNPLVVGDHQGALPVRGGTD